MRDEIEKGSTSTDERSDIDVSEEIFDDLIDAFRRKGVDQAVIDAAESAKRDEIARQGRG